MKILSAEQIREADAYTIKHEPIKSIDLMERAASRCFDWIYERAPQLLSGLMTGESDWRFQVVCGKGNNGGDGLAIARMLMRSGYNVEVIVVHYSDKASADFKSNYDRLGAAAKKQVINLKSEKDIPAFHLDALIVDALFGSGISRPIEGFTAAVVEAINASGAHVVSIDLPSGLPCDGAFRQKELAAVVADDVLSFQHPKMVFFLAEYAFWVGKVHILDIGLHAEFIQGLDTPRALLDRAMLAPLRHKRPRYSHKGSFGHALLIGGSPGKWGAIALAAKACMRSGAGLLTVQSGAAAASGLLAHVPEAMHSLHPGEDYFKKPPVLDPYRCIGVGPGLSTEADCAAGLKLLIQEAKVPLVIDADALNILAENKTWLAFLPKGSILTPHPGEWARLSGKRDVSHSEAIEAQLEMSAKHGIYIILKGAHSSLSDPAGRLWINSTGNPGMASAGTGDVLTGMLTGLLASGYSSLQAAMLGMYLHGAAGDLALENQSPESLMATDLCESIGAAFKQLGYDKAD